MQDNACQQNHRRWEYCTAFIKGRPSSRGLSTWSRTDETHANDVVYEEKKCRGEDFIETTRTAQKMWRVHGFLGRFLGRCHGSAPLRLSQGHHVEDEVRSKSTVLSSSLHASDSSSQRGEDGEKKQKKKTSQFCYRNLPQYTALDAVGWGAAAVIFMQICRRIHLQLSSPGEPNSGAGTHRELGPQRKCGYRVLLEILSQQDVLTKGVSVNCLKGSLEDQGGSSREGHASQNAEDSTFSSGESLTQSHDSAHSGEASLSAESPLIDTAHAEGPQQHKEGQSLEEELAASTDNLRKVGNSSIPIILNIIGIENARRGDCQIAFSCFLVAAQHDYNKAQFNVGVCYEKGQGVCRDPDKAAEFYKRAAAGGHNQAQFRYAKYLLHTRGQQSAESTRAAIQLLESAATAGVKEAQVYLGVLFTQKPLQDWQRAVHYLQMAAKDGDPVGLLYLGHCYTQGLGVVQCIKTAVHMYERAATGGNLEAQHILLAYRGRVNSVREDAVLRTTRSTPCFSSSNQFQNVIQMHDSQQNSAMQTLHHSWSMVSLHAWPLAELQNTESALLSSKTAPCGWTVGVG
ncbi:death ligand signal enhancer [Arapaima gigas]